MFSLDYKRTTLLQQTQGFERNSNVIRAVTMLWCIVMRMNSYNAEQCWRHRIVTENKAGPLKKLKIESAGASSLERED